VPAQPRRRASWNRRRPWRWWGRRCCPRHSRAGASVVGFRLPRGWGIGTGGSWGADVYALGVMLAAGGACAPSVVFVPRRVPAGDGPLRAFAPLPAVARGAVGPCGPGGRRRSGGAGRTAAIRVLVGAQMREDLPDDGRIVAGAINTLNVRVGYSTLRFPLGSRDLVPGSSQRRRQGSRRPFALSALLRSPESATTGRIEC